MLMLRGIAILVSIELDSFIFSLAYSIFYIRSRSYCCIRASPKSEIYLINIGYSLNLLGR
jgi:hypothetical protein